jgi:hypothetical protein
VTDQRIRLRRLAEKALADGQLPLAMLLEVMVPVVKLRELARGFGLSPKGGFRLERAPAHVLAPMLAELKEADRVDEVLAALVAGRGGEKTPEAGAGDADGDPAPEAGASVEPDLAPRLRLKEADLERARGELERAREGVARSLERESELRQRLDHAEEENRRLSAELLRRQTQTPPRADAGGGELRHLQQVVRDLEIEIEARAATDEALRRQLAVDRSRVRGLEAELAELEAVLPKGRRRKKAPEPPPAEPSDRRFVVPHFAPSFYRSLGDKDRRSIERAMQAILLFCTEGYAYPGLDVKQLGGQDTWSLRASLGLRVYFRRREDGDVEFLELANREDQHTTLRRLKDR